MPTPHHLEAALKATRDRRSFLKNLLIDALEWPIPDHVVNPEEIAFSWSAADLRTDGLDKPLVDGQVWQIQSLQANQPWGIFLLEFRQPDAFTSGRGLTGPLRKVLRGLVPSRRQHSDLATWKRENLLFICTHNYEHFRFAYFKAPLDNTRAAPLAAFGWGPDMPARTACEFNLPALVWPDAATSAADWITRWASAFDVEKVTRRFYDAYDTCFRAVEAAIAAEGSLTTADDLRMFTQTLLNRLMFLRFLERKGWLKFTGRQDYLRALHEAGPCARKSFYRGRLLPLFFEGLATETHGVSDAYGDVPFLNGGLFEPSALDGRVKEVPAEALGGLIGQDGLFYRFNFTVEESTPLDIEVAVDPEMLGKVFEELVTGRHESGSYYTPRPVVSFMCREALKGHLAGKTKAKPEAVAALIDRADVTGLTEVHGRQILNALDSLKAVDPACGSGAYLLGLLHELVAVYRLLMSEKLVKDRRSLYDLKLRIISNNLYGVDVDEFATNIAMLRLWLSLEVEAEEPLPLPNLDFKIETGDSLLGPDPGEMPDLFSQHLHALAGELLMLKEQYLTAHGEERERYRKAVAVAEAKIEKELSAVHGDGVIDWRVHFADVFVENKGFDIVLANPPYVRQELIKALKPTLKEIYPAVYTGTADLYCFFYARALQLLHSGGMLAFISSNKWLRAGYGAKLREYVGEYCWVHSITDFADLPVFQSAVAYPMIFVAQKEQAKSGPIFTAVKSLNPPYPDVLAIMREDGHKLPVQSLSAKRWALTATEDSEMLRKMESVGIPLAEYVKNEIYRGVMTGCNAAFFINSDKRRELIRGDKASAEIIKPLAIGADISRWRVEKKDRWLIFVPWELDIEQYPAIKEHLSHWKTELFLRPDCKEGRHHWWCMSRYVAGNVNTFEKRKILYQEIATHQAFALDGTGVFVNNKVFTILSDDLYLLAILNSGAAWTYLNHICAKLQRGALAMQRPSISKLPIPEASRDERSTIAALASNCLASRGQDCQTWEQEINQRVAALYGL